MGVYRAPTRTTGAASCPNRSRLIRAASSAPGPATSTAAETVQRPHAADRPGADRAWRASSLGGVPVNRGL